MSDFPVPIPGPTRGPIPSPIPTQFLAQLVGQFLAQFLLNSRPISTYPSWYNQPNPMDIGLQASSPLGVNFVPSSPLPACGVNPWPNSYNLNIEFIDIVLKFRGNCLLMLLKRLDYQYYLNN
jgi:hypothetical protein